MDKAMNTLPIQTYVRSRASTVVANVAGLSSGSVSLDLEKASDVTLVVATDPYTLEPLFFVAAIGRVPTLLDFDVILSPCDPAYVRNQSDPVLRLPPGATTIYWKGLSALSDAQQFPDDFARLVLAIDQ